MISPAHILIVDDDKNLLQLMSDILGEKYQVDTTDDAPEALGLIRQNIYDLVILDLGLPIISGEDLVRILRADPLTREIPILIVSAFPELREMVPPELVSGFLQKPFALAQLWHVVQNIVEPPGRHWPEDRLRNADGGLLELQPLLDWSVRMRREAQGTRRQAQVIKKRTRLLMAKRILLVAKAQEQRRDWKGLSLERPR